MTTYFNYRPSPVAPFAFSPVLDGEVYNAIVPWGLFGQRPYLTVNAIDGTWLLTTALVGSPTGLSLQAISWANGRATATTINPHGYKIGRIVTLTISGMVPDGYNGVVQALVTGRSTFSWALAANPGPATALGMAAFNINLVGALTDPNSGALLATASTLVFRQPSMQFEVAP